MTASPSIRASTNRGNSRRPATRKTADTTASPSGIPTALDLAKATAQITHPVVAMLAAARNRRPARIDTSCLRTR